MCVRLSIYMCVCVSVCLCMYVCVVCDVPFKSLSLKFNFPVGAFLYRPLSNLYNTVTSPLSSLSLFTARSSMSLFLHLRRSTLYYYLLSSHFFFPFLPPLPIPKDNLFQFPSLSSFLPTPRELRQCTVVSTTISPSQPNDCSITPSLPLIGAPDAI